MTNESNEASADNSSDKKEEEIVQLFDMVDDPFGKGSSQVIDEIDEIDGHDKSRLLTWLDKEGVDLLESHEDTGEDKVELLKGGIDDLKSKVDSDGANSIKFEDVRCLLNVFDGIIPGASFYEHFLLWKEDRQDETLNGGTSKASEVRSEILRELKRLSNEMAALREDLDKVEQEG